MTPAVCLGAGESTAGNLYSQCPRGAVGREGRSLMSIQVAGEGKGPLLGAAHIDSFLFHADEEGAEPSSVWLCSLSVSP